MLSLFLGRECTGKQMPALVEFVLPPPLSDLLLLSFLLHEVLGDGLTFVGDGKLESEVLPLNETILVMEIMDRVREIGGLKYPEQIERV